MSIVTATMTQSLHKIDWPSLLHMIFSEKRLVSRKREIWHALIGTAPVPGADQRLSSRPQMPQPASFLRLVV
jgi:hypothetical protein